MTRLELRVRPNDPVEADILIRFRTTSGFIDWVAAIVDTGAEATVLPMSLMDRLPYRLSPRGRVAVEQAGIARQSFEVIGAYLSVYLEDFSETRTAEFETLVWFTETTRPLLGITQMLDHTVLHLDMPALTGTLEFSD